MNSTCFSLDTSSACPDLHMQSVLVSPRFPNLAAFDSFIRDSSDNSTRFTNTFQDTYGCPGFAGHNIRFHQSLLCHFFVSYSIPHCPASKIPYKPLCQSSCLSHIDSVVSLFKDPLICTQTPSASSNRARILFASSTTSNNSSNTDLLYDACLTTLSSNDASKCVLGTAWDLKHAGFLESTDAIRFCNDTARLDPTDVMLCKDLSSDSVAPVHHPLDDLTRDQKLALIRPARDLPWIVSGIVWGVMVLGSLVWIGLVKSCWNDCKGRATLRRQAKQSNARKSIFDSVFGVVGWKGKVGNMGRGLEEVDENEERYDYGAPAKEIEEISEFDDVEGDFNDEMGLFQRMQVLAPYFPEKSDELSLVVGEIVIILETFDDGWVSARKESNGCVGIAPLPCLGSLAKFMSLYSGFTTSPHISSIRC
ncbi:hypothetical protein BCR33DRAFT_838774 [Rhizoclosmatium globosum]|uniref:SH3 domain-containing protein n=1 Tax=Rhizoclosmatium globosum TaxID=329046 RepID=A0A1Y2BEK8_9FUNG|nr:hypothetical protein BCR33DRAFT_838774 [Rhizoclosmatium globosum]|eukprot:ORY33278.1 hypothetical protein BCR33DRAFT_838774 [Rhizoclosmatium globosum]